MSTWTGVMRFSSGWTDPRDVYDLGPPDRYCPRRGDVLHVFADEDCTEWVIWHDARTGRTYTEAAW